MSTKKPAVSTMADIKVGQLFVVQGVGVLRKTHATQGTDRAGTIRVVYSNESVSLLAKRGA